MTVTVHNQFWQHLTYNFHDHGIIYSTHSTKFNTQALQWGPKMVHGLSFYVLNAWKPQTWDNLNQQQLRGIHTGFWLGIQTNVQAKDKFYVVTNLLFFVILISVYKRRIR